MKSFRSPLSICLLLMMSVSAMTLLSGCDVKIPGAEKIPGLEWLGTPPPAQQEEAEEETGEEEETEKPPPINAEKAMMPPAMRLMPYKEVRIPARDKVMLYGRLYDPEQKYVPPSEEGEEAEEEATDEEATSPTVTKYPLVILAPGLNRTQANWSDLPANLVKAGYAVFAMDMRGHGRSTVTAGKRAITWRLFEKEDWQKMPRDINEVIHYFQNNATYPQIDGTRTALFGEGIGANAAMLASLRDKDAVKAMVLISPGLDYKGLAPGYNYEDYPQPSLIMTSKEDEYAYDSAQKLYRWFVGPKKLELYQQSLGVGSDILSHEPQLQTHLMAWLAGYFPPKAVTAPRPAPPEDEEAEGEGH